MAPSLKRFYRPELDALRFFAFLGVFLFHGMPSYDPDIVRHPDAYRLGWLGELGVPLFFFLSAFLIVELLLRERDANGSVRLGAFYLRRILRIWPLYFFVFFGLALLNHFIPGANPHARASWPYFTFFLGNWYFAHHGFTGGPVDPLWSISVEEQFYLFIPLVAAFGGRRGLRLVSLAVIAISYWTIYRYARFPWNFQGGEWISSLVQFQFFAGGALLAVTLRGRLPAWQWPARTLAFLSAFACWIVAQSVFGVRGLMPFGSTGKSLAGMALVLAGCLLFFLSFLGIAAERTPRWLAYLGRIAFGLYIYHSIIFGLAGTIIGPALLRGLPIGSAGYLPVIWIVIACVLAVTIGIAHLSYVLLERPFLRLKQRFELVPSRPE